ncbi:MAG: hypothetical protein KAS47_05620 [Candidatus Heimdallarchaeota archaeon]|nr:hypothetical protein [Candidatus Heimdallarchaeota archaeon]
MLKAGNVVKMTTSSDDRMCKLTCKSFSCGKRMLRVKRNSGSKSFICGLDDSECLGYMCSYAECRERKLRDSGECLRPVKPVQRTQSKKPKGQFPSYVNPTHTNVDEKFRKKLDRKSK